MRIARVVAVVAGLIGVVMALATPLLPVQQTTAQIDWPQTQAGAAPSAPVSSIVAPLVGYVPVDVEVSVPCSAAALLGGTDGSVLVSTTPKQAEKAVARGLFVRLSGRSTDALDSRSVEVVVRNIPVVSATIAQIRAQGCRSIEVRATSDEVTAEFVGMTGQDGKPLQGSTSGGDQRPQLTGVYTDLTAPRTQLDGLTLHATIDSRYSTAATPLKWVAIGVGVVTTLIALAALAVLDGTDGRRHRRIFPARWWRLNPRDLVVIGGLVVWHVIGANTSDDGYLLTMARVADHAHYTANYYRWFGAPEAPFGWYYSVFGWLAHISTASPLVRLPALLCGIAVWLIVSHEILPRLGRAAITTPIVPWTAAAVFLASWFPFNNGLRPEPIICLGALLTWCSVERAIATGRTLPAAVACTAGAFSLAAGPTGLMAVAALVAGGRPMIMAVVTRSRVIRGDGSRWSALLALLAPVVAAGTAVIYAVFSNLTLTAFLQSSKMKTALGPSLHWYNEIDRYSSLFAFSADGSIGRRFAVLMMLVGLVVSATLLFRKSRIPGTAKGPTQRIVGITFASLVFLMFTPTKWTHHFGVFAGLAAALAAITAIAVTGRAMRSPRNRVLVTALVLFVTGLAFTGPNAYYYMSNWGMPYGTQTVTVVVALGSILLYASFAALAVAGWLHLRAPYAAARPPSATTLSPATAATSAGARGKTTVAVTARRIAGAPILAVATAIVAFEIVTAVLSGVNQSGSFSVPSSNIDALAGSPCAMADTVMVEPDPSANLMTPVDPTLRTPLAGSGTVTGGSGTVEDDGSDRPTPSVTTGFTPNGLPMSLAAEANAQSLGVLATSVTASSDVLTSSSGGTVGGETDRAGANGSFAKLPFGLDPARTPVLGSYSQNDQAPASLTSGWYRLPARSADRPFVSMAVAGSFDIRKLELQYTTDSGSRDGDLTAAGAVGLIDPGPSPSWRNLRIYRSSLPADATAVRIVAVDDNLAADSFMVVTPPRAPRVQTLQSYVGSTDPVQIDWTSGLAFPCQRPFDHRDGVAEVPKWRIMPGADLSAAVSAWMNASGGGPLGWIEVTLESTTVPSYLRDDIGRDWGALIRYTPYDTAVRPAQLEKGTTTRSGLWSPAPIRYR